MANLRQVVPGGTHLAYVGKDLIESSRAADGWNMDDLSRVLSCVGGRVWKGRVRLEDENLKFVGHRSGWLSDWLGWNNDSWPFGNFDNKTPGIYDVIFDEDNHHDPVLILVKPFAGQAS